MTELTTHDRIVAARVRMLEREPFFGLIAARLELKPDHSVNGSYTDGKTFAYNPDWAEKVSFDGLMTAVAKAACHCALLHTLRRGTRDYRLWQQSCNQVVWENLKSAGFPIPKDAKLDDQQSGRAVEEIYAELDAQRVKSSPSQPQQGKPEQSKGQDQAGAQGAPKKDDKDEQGQGGSGQSDDNKPGDQQGQGQGSPNGQNEQPHEVRDQPSQSGGTMDEGERTAEEQKALKDMAATMQQASAISGAGLPGNLKQLLNGLLFPKMDWLNLIKDHLSKQSNSDYTYSRYSKSGWCMKPRQFLPALRAIGELDTLVFAVDTSISMNTRKLKIAGGGLIELMEDLKFAKLIVIYCDARIQRVDEYEKGDEIEIHAVGRGNTSLIPPFVYLEQNEIEPDALIYFTDLGGPSPDVKPNYPVFWLDQDGRHENRMRRFNHNFGRYVPMNS